MTRSKAARRREWDNPDSWWNLHRRAGVPIVGVLRPDGLVRVGDCRLTLDGFRLLYPRGRIVKAENEPVGMAQNGRE